MSCPMQVSTIHIILYLLLYLFPQIDVIFIFCNNVGNVKYTPTCSNVRSACTKYYFTSLYKAKNYNVMTLHTEMCNS